MTRQSEFKKIYIILIQGSLQVNTFGAVSTTFLDKQ